MNIPSMKNKSAIAALATLGVTAVAATATAVVKIRNKRREARALRETENDARLSPQQQMVYNEAVREFIILNDRIYELRRHHAELQPLLSRLALLSTEPLQLAEDDPLKPLADQVERFVREQVPFINASLRGTELESYEECLRVPIGRTSDPELDEELSGDDVNEGTAVRFVLKAGYYFPDCTLVLHPVKSIILI